MTAFSDETGELLAETKRIIACGVTDFPVYQAIALLEKFEAALSASPVGEPTREAVAAMLARMLYNDATLDESTAEQRASWLAAADAIRKMYRRSSPVAQEPVGWEYEVAQSFSKEKGYHDWQRCLSPLKPDEFKHPYFRNLSPVYRASPPATSAGVGADEIARVIDDAINKYGSLMFIQEHGWSGFCAKVREHALALLSRAGDQK